MLGPRECIAGGGGMATPARSPQSAILLIGFLGTGSPKPLYLLAEVGLSYPVPASHRTSFKLALS